MTARFAPGTWFPVDQGGASGTHSRSIRTAALEGRGDRLCVALDVPWADRRRRWESRAAGRAPAGSRPRARRGRRAAPCGRPPRGPARRSPEVRPATARRSSPQATGSRRRARADGRKPAPVRACRRSARSRRARSGRPRRRPRRDPARRPAKAGPPPSARPAPASRRAPRPPRGRPEARGRRSRHPGDDRNVGKVGGEELPRGFQVHRERRREQRREAQGRSPRRSEERLSNGQRRDGRDDGQREGPLRRGPEHRERRERRSEPGRQRRIRIEERRVAGRGERAERCDRPASPPAATAARKNASPSVPPRRSARCHPGRAPEKNTKPTAAISRIPSQRMSIETATPIRNSLKGCSVG